MTLKISGSLGLRLSHPGSLSFKAGTIDTPLIQTFFIFGTKRTTGAPTTLADLTDPMVGTLINWDSGSFAIVEGGWTVTAKKAFTASIDFPSALSGDHLFLAVAHSSDPNPPPETTFDALLPMGTLRS